jgi:methionine sulfoxide reductase heme-binding subunit
MLRRLWRLLTNLLAAVANWRYFKPVVFVGCFIPGVLLGAKLWQFFVGQQFDVLGTDPNITVLHETGEDAFGFLIASLAITPIRRVFKINRVQIVRRLLGVTAFFYALAHVTAYLTFDQLCYSLATCDFHGIWTDVLKRKFVFAGAVAFTILTALAITSTAGWVRRLKKKWTTLHRLVYVAAIAAAIHYVWGQKSDISEPLRWAGYVLVLLGIRVYFSWRKRAARSPQSVARRPVRTSETPSSDRPPLPPSRTGSARTLPRT